MSRLFGNYKKMIEHPVFNDVMSKDGVSDTQAIFNSEGYLKGMANAGYYLCAGNVLWGKVVVDDTAPASKAKTDEWMKTYYAKAEGEFPSHMQWTFVIGVVEGSEGPLNKQSRGQLPMISPPSPATPSSTGSAKGSRKAQAKKS